MKKILIMFLVMIFSVSMSIAKEYNFVSIKGLIDQDVSIVVMTKVYKNLGWKLNVEPLPGKRAQMLATSGEKDGEVMRIFNYGKENPTVVRVPTAFMKVETVAYVKKGSGISAVAKGDLGKYKIVKISGVKHTAAATKGISGVQDVKGHEQLFGMLLKGRAQVALTDALAGAIYLKKLGHGDKIERIAKPLAQLDLFHYPHEKHKANVPKIDAELKKIKDSGELEKIIKGAIDAAAAK